jgi:tetratricopeptide (TPR) repeat protein
MCVAFVPNAKPFTFIKRLPSVPESSPITEDKALPSFTTGTKAGALEVRIVLSSDPISELGLSKEKLTHPRIFAIPAFGSTYDSYYDFGKLALGQGYCTLFANVAEYGGSKAFVGAASASRWFEQNDGTKPIPKGSEALLVVEADLERPLGTKKSKPAQAALIQVGIYPSLYPANSSQEENYLQVIPEPTAPKSELGELVKRVAPFISLGAKSFPTLLQDKLQHFVSHVVPVGTLSGKDMENWIRPIVLPDLLSPDLLRWELCNEAVQVINTLQLSSEHIDKAGALMQVYAHLLAKRNALMPSITPKPKSVATVSAHSDLEARTASTESPFRDRDHPFEQIRSFMNQTLSVAFVLCGMKGIGKSSVIDAAFCQVIPPTRKIRLQVTEGMPYARLLLDLAYKFDLRMADGALDLSAQKLEAIKKRLFSHVSQAQPTVIVLDDFQFLLNNAREIEDPSIRDLIRDLLNTASNAKTKCFIVSNTAPQLGPDLESKCSVYSLQGLEATYTKGLLQYWFQFGREDLAGQVPQPSDQLVKLLAGHPLAIRLAARLWSEHPSVDISKDIEIFQELRDTIVSFLLEKITLSKSENDLMSFASIFRLPAPRAVFLRWGGNEANYVLNSLTSQYLIESSADGYQLHPLVRDFFYHNLGTKQELAHHKIAGRFFEEQITKAKLAGKAFVPEDLAEAVHHYLEAADWTKVKSLNYYKEELKPVARSHYQRKEFMLAYRDYKVLLELDKNDVDAHFHLALIHARNGEWDDAELHFGRAIEIKGKAPWILQGYASALMRSNKLAEAEELLREAEEINPHHSSTLVDLGQLMEKRGHVIEAVDYYRRAVASDPESSFAYFLSARLLYREGEIEEAYEFALTAMATNPTDERNKALVQELKDKSGQGTDRIVLCSPIKSGSLGTAIHDL